MSMRPGPLFNYSSMNMRPSRHTQLNINCLCPFLVCKFFFLRPTLMGTKNLDEIGPNPFFPVFFQSYGNDNGPDSYSQIRLSVS